MNIFLTLVLTLPWAVEAVNMLGYKDAVVAKENRNLKKKSSTKDADLCATGTCVSNFGQLKAALGQDRSSAEIYICAGSTILFNYTLYVYSDATKKPQAPFELKLWCCDCNCVLDGATEFGALWFTKQTSPYSPLSGMKLTMNGIRLQGAGSFFSYLKDDSEYKEIGSCPNSIDLSTVAPFPFAGYEDESTSLTKNDGHLTMKKTELFMSSEETNSFCAAEKCVGNFKEFAAALGQDKQSAEIYICPGATIIIEETLYVYSTKKGIQPPFELQILCCDCNCVVDASGAILFESNDHAARSGMKLTMNGIKLKNAPFGGTNVFVYLSENSEYNEVGSCPNSFDLSKMAGPFVGVEAFV